MSRAAAFNPLNVRTTVEMGPLKNPRHEAFVRYLLEGKTALDAYEAAGFKRDLGNASRLKARPDVAARLAEMQNEIAATVPITIESLIGELEEVRSAATSKSQYAAAVRAVLGKAQLAGLLVERQKVEVSGSIAYDKCETMEEVIEVLLDDMQKYSVNDYHDFRPEDRVHLAELFTRHFKAMFDESRAYLNAIKARPYRTNYKPTQSLPNPFANGHSQT